MAAFYDDSGGFNPDRGKFACFGMCVVSARYIRECGDAWWEMLGNHFQFSGTLEMNNIEAKSSELHDMLRCLENKRSLNKVQQKMFDNGLNTATKVGNLIEAIFTFLSKPPVQAKYLAVVANKEETWLQFRQTQFSQWKILAQLKNKQKSSLKTINEELTSFLISRSYEYLLQRLEYLSKDPDFDFSDALVVGDQSSSIKTMLETQAGVQAGLGKFSDLPSIVNKSWFGSSLHDPCLQMSDWIAFTVRTWAERRRLSRQRLERLLPNFRGYPDPDWLIGRGIVLLPNKESFPNLPLRNNRVNIPF